MALGLLIGCLLALLDALEVGLDLLWVGEIIGNRCMDLLKCQRGITQSNLLGTGYLLVIAHDGIVKLTQNRAELTEPLTDYSPKMRFLGQ